MRILKTSIRTAWRADWLAEFSMALIALAFLTREIIFAVVGAGILLLLASLGLLFHQRLGVLRGQLYVAARLTRARVILGDSIEGDLTIRNESRLAAQVIAVAPVVEKGLSFKLSSSSNQLLRPDTTSSSKFEITSLKSGRFQISGFMLTFADARGLFTGEVNYEQGDIVEFYPGMRTRAPLTPLRLYGGSPEVSRVAPTGTDYAGVHQYEPGDEYHRVEWKATARLRTLMVKEFHPETQTTIQILIDAGRTMHQESYIGTKLDEALAVAQLLLEAALGSTRRVGIWVYNETEIVRAIRPTIAEEQLASLQGPALTFRAEAAGTEHATRVPHLRASARRMPELPHGSRVTVFLRSLRAKLGLGYRKTGVYMALGEAARTDLEGSFIVLTDLQVNSDALLEAASIQRQRGRTIVAQIGAAWRLSFTLEEAYSKYQINDQILRRLRESGLMVFDNRPEELIEVVVRQMLQQKSP